MATLKNAASGYNVTYSYTYDNNGNIKTVSDGTYTTTYTYDNQNQLTREDNQQAGKSWTWTYDDAGNILSKKEYAYTTGTLGTAQSTKSYTYDSNWGDLLTAYNGNTISSDAIGNMTNDGTWTYTWEHGRELATMSSGGTTWTYTYDADGMRTKRTTGSSTYTYTYIGGQLSFMTVNGQAVYITHDASGQPMTINYGGTTYYYATNLQGDVTAIINTSGTAVVTYTYDAWGNILSTGGTMASTLGAANPLRYRGYVYDPETGLYYLQSRYYNPALGRFVNCDAFATTGQGLLGNNMFAYCNNNPVNLMDPTGKIPFADGFFDENFSEAGRLLYEFLTGRTHPDRQTIEMNDDIIAEQNKLITDIAKTTDEAGMIDIGMAAYHTIQATRSFKKAIAYYVVPIPTPIDEGFAIGYALKGLYHLIKFVGRTT